MRVLRYYLMCGPLYYAGGWGIGSDWVADRRRASDFVTRKQALIWRAHAGNRSSMHVVTRWE